MDEKVVIAVICGTSREGRVSVKAAQWVAEQGRQREDTEIVFVDPKDFPMGGDGDNAETRNEQFAHITERAEAFYIVTPEYNHGYPGSLKRLLDSEFDNYFHKPVVVAGVSDGPWGGVRVCEALLPVLHTMSMIIVKGELYFPKADKLFDDQNNMVSDRNDAYIRSVHKAYDELVWFAKLLRHANAQP